MYYLLQTYLGGHLPHLYLAHNVYAFGLPDQLFYDTDIRVLEYSKFAQKRKIWSYYNFVAQFPPNLVVS